MSEPGAAIRVRGLELARHGPQGPVPILGGIDVDVADGEIVALVGPSGCGKSTLLRLLAGLEAPTHGAVTVAEAPPRLGALALMPQADALLPWATAFENVLASARFSGAAVPEDAARDALARMGLVHHGEHYPHALSGGMRQRVALARTLVSGAGAWLLDEPFGALDALTRSDLHRELERAWALERPSVLLVTHDIDEALLLADRVYVSGPRPARIAAEIEVPLPRPRRVEMTATSELAELKIGVLTALAGAGVAS